MKDKGPKVLFWGEGFWNSLGVLCLSLGLSQTGCKVSFSWVSLCDYRASMSLSWPFLQKKPTSAAPAILLQGSSHTAAQRPVYPAGADLLTSPIVLTPVQSWNRACGRLNDRNINSATHDHGRGGGIKERKEERVVKSQWKAFPGGHRQPTHTRVSRATSLDPPDTRHKWGTSQPQTPIVLVIYSVF